MRDEYKIIALSVACFALVCTTDALLDDFVFHETPFWDSLILKVPTHAVYHRSFVGVAFVLFGLPVARSLAKRRAVEQALKESEEKYRTIFENSPLGILHFDGEGVITACNENVGRILGVPRERVAGFSMPLSLAKNGTAVFTTPRRLHLLSGIRLVG